MRLHAWHIAPASAARREQAESSARSRLLRFDRHPARCRAARTKVSSGVRPIRTRLPTASTKYRRGALLLLTLVMAHLFRDPRAVQANRPARTVRNLMRVREGNNIGHGLTCLVWLPSRGVVSAEFTQNARRALANDTCWRSQAAWTGRCSLCARRARVA